MSILNPLFEAVAWVMSQIHRVLAVPFGASSGATWALTIIILVVLMRLVMVPLFIKQRNSMQKMQSHMPQLQELRKKYKNDKTRLNEETMKFYKENGINPLGGCLPLVAQLPVFWSLFNVLKAVAQYTSGAPKYGMSVSLVQSAQHARIFGIALVDQFLHPVTGETSTSRYLIVVFVLVSAGTTFLTMRQSQKRGMMNQTAPDPDQPGAAVAQSMSKNMMYIAPFFALTGLYWQFGLVLYWVTTNVWTLGQQHFLFRRLPVVGSATVGSATAASGTSAAKPAAARTATRATAAKNGASSGSGTKTSKPGDPAKASGVKSVGARPAGAKPAGARPAGTRPAGTRPATAASSAAKSASAKPGQAKTAAGKPAGAKPAAAKTAAAQPAAEVTAADPVAEPAEVKAKVKVNGSNGASANGSGNGSGGSGVLRLFGRGKEEPQDDVSAEPANKVVRQQPVRQTRSKRGNTGKR